METTTGQKDQQSHIRLIENYEKGAPTYDDCWNRDSFSIRARRRDELDWKKLKDVAKAVGWVWDRMNEEDWAGNSQTRGLRSWLYSTLQFSGWATLIPRS